MEADLGDAAALFRQVGEHLGLMDGEAHGLLDVEVEALLQAPDPDVVHDVGLADDVDGVRRDVGDHLSVVGVALFNAVLVGGGAPATLPNARIEPIGRVAVPGRRAALLARFTHGHLGRLRGRPHHGQDSLSARRRRKARDRQAGWQKRCHGRRRPVSGRPQVTHAPGCGSDVGLLRSKPHLGHTGKSAAKS